MYANEKVSKEDLFFIFRRLYERGKISKEEMDKCNEKVMEGVYKKDEEPA